MRRKMEGRGREKKGEVGRGGDKVKREENKTVLKKHHTHRETI